MVDQAIERVPETGTGTAPVTAGAGSGTPAGLRARIAGELRDPLLRNGYALMASTVATAVLGVGYWILAARLYPAAAVGRASAVLALAMAFAGFTQGNIGWTLSRFLPTAPTEAPRLVRGGYAIAAASGAVLTFGVLTVVAGQADPGSLWDISLPARVVFAAGVGVWNLFTVQDQVLAGIGRGTVVPLENAGFSAVKLLLLVALAGTASAASVVVSWAVPTIAGVAVVSALLFRRYLPAFAANASGRRVFVDRKVLRSFAVGEYLASTFTQAAATLLPVLVAAKLDADHNAVFYAVWVAGTTVDLISTGMWQSLLVEGAADPRRVAGLARQAARRLCLLLVPTLGLGLLAAPLVLSVYGPFYRDEGTAPLRLLLAAGLVRIVVTFFFTLCRLYHAVGVLVATQAAIAVSAVLGGWAVIGGAGMTGVLTVWFAVNAVAAVLCVRPCLDLVRSGGPRSVQHG